MRVKPILLASVLGGSAMLWGAGVCLGASLCALLPKKAALGIAIGLALLFAVLASRAFSRQTQPTRWARLAAAATAVVVAFAVGVPLVLLLPRRAVETALLFCLPAGFLTFWIRSRAHTILRILVAVVTCALVFAASALLAVPRVQCLIGRTVSCEVYASSLEDEESIPVWERACQLGSDDACAEAARLLPESRAETRAPYLRRGCAGGYSSYCREAYAAESFVANAQDPCSRLTLEDCLHSKECELEYIGKGAPFRYICRSAKNDCERGIVQDSSAEKECLAKPGCAYRAANCCLVGYFETRVSSGKAQDSRCSCSGGPPVRCVDPHEPATPIEREGPRTIACRGDRARSPLEDRAVGVAAADLVAVVTPTSFGAGAVSVQVVAVLKSEGTVVAQGDRLWIKGIGSDSDRADRVGCWSASMGAGKSYLVLLWSPIPGTTDYDLVDEDGGLLHDTQQERAALQTALAKRQPCSPWRAGPSGIQTRLVVAAEQASGKGEVDLVVLLRNTGRAAVDYTHQSWPPDLQSSCALRIENLDSKRLIEARDVPISKDRIAEYFTRNSRSYERKIAPGESHYFRLPRVTTAAKGWGYKEELGFRYYPVAQPGLHSIAAECSNYLGPGSLLTTEALTVGL